MHAVIEGIQEFQVSVESRAGSLVNNNLIHDKPETHINKVTK